MELHKLLRIHLTKITNDDYQHIKNLLIDTIKCVLSKDLMRERGPIYEKYLVNLAYCFIPENQKYFEDKLTELVQILDLDIQNYLTLTNIDQNSWFFDKIVKTIEERLNYDPISIECHFSYMSLLKNLICSSVWIILTFKENKLNEAKLLNNLATTSEEEIINVLTSAGFSKIAQTYSKISIIWQEDFASVKKHYNVA